MRIDLYTKAILTIIALLLAVMLIRPITSPQHVAAQVSYPGIAQGYMWLSPQAVMGDKEFIDLRNGRAWDCDFKGCKFAGQYPFNQIQ